MGNVYMEATQINYRGGSKKMNVEEAIKEAGTAYELPEATPETLGGVMIGDGLKATAGMLDVKIKPSGNLYFTQEGELEADNWTPPAFTTNESESGFTFGSDKIYQKVLSFDTPISLTSNTWVDLGVTMDVKSCILGVALAPDGTSIPICITYNNLLGLQALNMRSV